MARGAYKGSSIYQGGVLEDGKRLIGIKIEQSTVVIDAVCKAHGKSIHFQAKDDV